MSFLTEFRDSNLQTFQWLSAFCCARYAYYGKSESGSWTNWRPSPTTSLSSRMRCPRDIYVVEAAWRGEAVAERDSDCQGPAIENAIEQGGVFGITWWSYECPKQWACYLEGSFVIPLPDNETAFCSHGHKHYWSSGFWSHYVPSLLQWVPLFQLDAYIMWARLSPQLFAAIHWLQYQFVKVSSMRCTVWRWLVRILGITK